MVQQHPLFFSILKQNQERPTGGCVTKALLSTLNEKMHASFINCVGIFPVINNCIHHFHRTTIIICLRMHIFGYHISRVLFDLIISELDIMCQSVEKRIGGVGSLCIAIYVFRLTNNFRFPQKIPLRQIKSRMNSLIGNRFLKNWSTIKNDSIIIIRQLN